MGRNVGNESYSARSDPQPRKTSMPETSYNNNNNNNNNQNIDYYPPRKLSTPTSPADYMAVNRSRTMNSTPSPPLSTPSLGPGKMKIKLHSIPSNGGNQRTVMLLVDANQFPAITYKTLITRCRDKFGYRNPTVSYKDPEDYNQHGISVVDDDDLSVAMEILDGRVEFWVSDN
ncbi:uncharacterized protein EV422DRAFT_533177 [Fimicolochytrium jonesii]|uniref:uncharacterized protein n=1 Tax=Fimicolochytrium jonesii TaxID=1396493 RepID=UPI0022FE226D|nr:uncharacterized protein EV422DRAFT_533177 [Fimicolochytrium jonesii]KAI8820007.1 hypothetical protein EV422DRAFT_533177 [Fimicolochytrium jonesii]